MPSLEQIAKEDLMTFINAAYACTGQREFYGDGHGQSVSIAFLHDYIQGNYRRLYARMLATGINHFNKAEIVRRLLRDGAPVRDEDRKEEGALIRATLRALPANRSYSLLDSLRRERVNNRRTRASIRDFIAAREPSLDAVKYRVKVRALAVHAHLRFHDERDRFLYRGWAKEPYTTPLFESFRAAHHSEAALYDLPYTVAEGLARKLKVPRERFLSHIAKQMTVGEQLRTRELFESLDLDAPDFDLGRAPLTKLAIMALAQPLAKRDARLDDGLTRSAKRAFERAPFHYGKVALVLDRSASSFGSSEKARRPLAVAVASAYLLRHGCERFTWHPTAPCDSPLHATPYGQSAIAQALLSAIATEPDLVLIVSDGYENDPPGAASEIVRVYKEKKLGGAQFLHLNPVYASDDLAPRALGDALPTLGIRDAEDLPTVIGFARFATGTAPLHELEAYLARQAQGIIG